MKEIKDFISRFLNDISEDRGMVSAMNDMDRVYQTEYNRGQKEVCEKVLTLIVKEFSERNSNMPRLFSHCRETATELRKKLMSIEKTEDVNEYGMVGNINGQIDCYNLIRNLAQTQNSSIASKTQGSKKAAAKVAELAKKGARS